VDCRRTFLKKSAVGVAALSVPTLSACRIDTLRPGTTFAARKPQHACILWYSQTGFTAKSGRAIADTLQAQGISVTSGDIRSTDQGWIDAADLVVIGSPVFYYDTPRYVKEWIQSLPDLGGKPVAAYVTFGGPEGNQHNAAYAILDHLADRGGVPVAMGTFMSVSTFPLSWPEERQTLNEQLARFDRNRPQASAYAMEVVRQVESGRGEEFHKKLTLREITTHLGPVWWTKRLIQRHTIDADRCVQCGTCVRKCPVDAIDPPSAAIDTDACVLCFGCLNNCPEGAIRMESSGKRLVGFLEMMEENASQGPKRASVELE